MINIENIEYKQTHPNTGLITSEMMQQGVMPEIVMAGACATVTESGVIRNPGRDTLTKNLTQKGHSYFEVQISEETHKRGYIYEKDGPAEKKAREEALVRVYEIRNDTISGVTHEEIMDDHNNKRRSIVWVHSEGFAPIGLGDRKTLEANKELRNKVGDLIFEHLLAYVNCGRQMRTELEKFLPDSPHVTFVRGDETLVAEEIEKALTEAKLNKKNGN
jgi:hypothetical protein